jgi:hypothetical protein
VVDSIAAREPNPYEFLSLIRGVAMKRALILGLFVLSACGGGGGGSSSAPPTPTPIPIANTSLSYFLPLANGNTWTFATGGKFVDVGGGTMGGCACPADGVKIEQIALYSPGSTSISGSFFFSKTSASGNFGPLTNILGIEQDANNNHITVISDSTYPSGFPIMDDVPSVNEYWIDNGAQSTITSVGGTMYLPGGAKIINVANDQLTSSAETISWSLAKGVGFTGIGVGTQSTTITSFYVNTSTSTSESRQSESVRHFYGKAGHGDVRSLLSKLF